MQIQAESDRRENANNIDGDDGDMTVQNLQQERVPSSSEDTSKKETERKGINRLHIGIDSQYPTAGRQRSKRQSMKESR